MIELFTRSVGQTGVTFGDPLVAIATLVTFALLSLLGGATIALVYRWYFAEAVPEGIAVLIGVAVVALYINTASLGAIVSSGGTDLFQIETVLFNVVVLGVASLAAPVGRRAGDAVGTNVLSMPALRQFEGDMGTVVRSAGRVTTVTLPDEIEDMVSYDPVSDEIKAEMAGKQLVFPRRLTVGVLRERLISRIKEDYAIGYVDVDLTEEGEVAYLAVGSRMAGVGPTLAPGTVAVALSADPPNDASPGDLIQIWRTGEKPKRLVSGELRGVASDVVTVAIDAADADRIDPAERYRVITLPEEPQPDREFATLLRGVDETMAAIDVAPGSELSGEVVRETGVIVVAIRSTDGTTASIPDRDRRFVDGETVYALGRPDVLRRLEDRAHTPKEDDDATDDEPPEGGDAVAESSDTNGSTSTSTSADSGAS